MLQSSNIMYSNLSFLRMLKALCAMSMSSNIISSTISNAWKTIREFKLHFRNIITTVSNLATRHFSNRASLFTIAA